MTVEVKPVAPRGAQSERPRKERQSGWMDCRRQPATGGCISNVDEDGGI